MAIQVKRDMLDIKKYVWQASKGDNPTDRSHDRIQCSAGARGTK